MLKHSRVCYMYSLKKKRECTWQMEITISHNEQSSKKTKNYVKMMSSLWKKWEHACTYICRIIVYEQSRFPTSIDAVRIFIRRLRNPPWRRNFRRTGFGYDSTPYDHYNYATSQWLLMAILLQHLIAPADCFRQFLWILSRMRTTSIRA